MLDLSQYTRDLERKSDYYGCGDNQYDGYIDALEELLPEIEALRRIVTQFLTATADGACKYNGQELDSARTSAIQYGFPPCT